MYFSSHRRLRLDCTTAEPSRGVRFFIFLRCPEVSPGENKQAAPGVNVWIRVCVKQSRAALFVVNNRSVLCLEKLLRWGLLTCSLVVRPLATSTMWKPVSPMTGMKKSPAMHITTRLDIKVKLDNVTRR